MNTVERAHREMMRNDKRRIFLWVGISVLIIGLCFGAWFLEHQRRDPSAIKGLVEAIDILDEEGYTDVTIRTQGLFGKTKVFRIDSDTKVIAYTGEMTTASEIAVGSRISVKAERYDGDVGIAWMVRIVGYPDSD